MTSEHVRHLLCTRQEIAFLDVREEDAFASGHPLFASQMSLGRLELEAFDRIPRRDVTVVVYDDGEGRAQAAAAKLRLMGYCNTHVLAGNLAGWRAAGFELFQDVNSYCKAFGELVEARRHTPSLPAREVHDLIASGANIVVLDARRFEEYATMSIPTGTSVPGAELVLQARALAPDPETTVIVNCAGRTRSIVGTQSLVNAALPNPVFALRNGTIGWTLAGLELETGQTREAAMVDANTLSWAQAAAARVSYAAGVRQIKFHQLELLRADPVRTLYLFDVRSHEEYCAGHLPGFRHAPGGQLVQETDVFAPVRGARIVLADGLGPRAHMTASWLAQMGWEVFVLDCYIGGAVETGFPPRSAPAVPEIEHIGPVELDDLLRCDGAMLIDLARSPHHRAGHIPGARFALRAELNDALNQLPVDGRPLVLTCETGILAAFAAHEINVPAKVLRGGTKAWSASGRSLETGLESPLTAANDVYKRPYEGTANSKEKMQAYLDWEYGLIEQLERDGSHGFFVI